MTGIPGFAIGERKFPLRHFSFEEGRKFMPTAASVIGCDILKRHSPKFNNEIDPHELVGAVRLMTGNAVSESWILNQADSERLRELISLQVQWDGMLEHITSVLEALNKILAKGPQA